ncbi:MAG: potassium transporter TrkG, partial [Lawsonibacter sp.]
SVLVFVGGYLTVLLLATLMISLDNFSFATSFSSALTCISNVGPGLEMVGPTGNFSAFSHPSKVVMSLCMIIGRLEILPILVLFSRSTWRRT